MEMSCPYVEILSVTISLKSGKSWAVQTEETEPANNQFPVGGLSKIHQGKYLTIPLFLTHFQHDKSPFKTLGGVWL